jgi:prolyl-tRNA editing enzyme YbaK/EbsC (Cys-tRNA(Pro) deacylase)
VNDPLASASVQRVRQALAEAGLAAEVMVLAATARTAQDAAASVGCALGAITKTLVFDVGGGFAQVLIAGDRRCDTDVLASALGASSATRAEARRVREETGFAIGGVAPVGHMRPLSTVIDASLGRFPAVYAAAGHPHCVFATTLTDLARLTGGIVVEGLGVES